MGKTGYHRKATKATAAKQAKAKTPVLPEPKPLDQIEITMEAKEMFARAIEGSGGLQRLIDFMNSSNANYGMVVGHYAKLIPLQTVSQVKATVEVGADKQLAAAMVDALCRIQKARESGIDAKGVIIDKTVTIEHQPKTEEPQPPPLVININKDPPEPSQPHIVVDNDKPAVEKPWHPGAPREPSSTELFYDWIGSRRHDPWSAT